MTEAARGVTIRPLRAADAPAFVALMADVAREGVWIATEWPFDVDARAARMTENLDAGRVVSWGAFCHAALVEGPALVGEISVFVDGTPPHIGMLVAATHRGRGIGRALLETATGWARTQGHDAIELTVFPENERAIALYRSAGFAAVAYEPAALTRRDGTTRGLVRMRLALRLA